MRMIDIYAKIVPVIYIVSKRALIFCIGRRKMSKKSIILVMVGFILVYGLFKLVHQNNDEKAENEGEEIVVEKDQSEYDQSTNEVENKRLITDNYTSKSIKISKNTTAKYTNRSKAESYKKNDTAGIISKTQTKVQPTLSPAEINTKIQNLSKSIPMSHVQVSNDSSTNPEIFLSFNTLKKDTCHWGDLDAISKDVGQSELLLSIESILPNDNSFTPVTQFVTLASLERGSFEFTLPRVDSPVFLGLYLCKDSSNSRRCNNKSAQSLSKLMMALNSGAKVTNPHFTKDKIYFFQSFILTHNDIYILDPAKVNSNSQELYDTVLSITGLPEKQVSSMIKKVKSINKNILSENVTTYQKTINLLLPKHSDEACKKQDTL